MTALVSGGKLPRAITPQIQARLDQTFAFIKRLNEL
jgi:hypothetical protein